jgi:hypothetical protein
VPSGFTKPRPKADIGGVFDGLPDAPQYPGRIDDHEVADAPWPILGGINLHAIIGRQPIVLNVAPSGHIRRCYRIGKDANAHDMRRDFLEQFDPFASQ